MTLLFTVRKKGRGRNDLTLLLAGIKKKAKIEGNDLTLLLTGMKEKVKVEGMTLLLTGMKKIIIRKTSLFLSLCEWNAGELMAREQQ